MKKIATFLLLLVLGASLMAQTGPERKHKHKKEPPRIEEMVSDLSAVQKKRLSTLMDNSRKEMDRLQADLENVRKQIRALMDKDEDCTDQLFPLFDREATLRAEISKEMYRTRRQIDNILTKEQLVEFRARCAADCKKGKPSKNKSVTPAKTYNRADTPAGKPHRARR